MTLTPARTRRACMLVGAVLLAAAGCRPGPVPTGGACEYQGFETTCHLGDVAVATPAGTDPATVQAEYVPSGVSFVGGLMVVRQVPAAQAGALVAHFRAHADVPCHGKHIISGSCTPTMGTVDVPPFAPAP